MRARRAQITGPWFALAWPEDAVRITRAYGGLACTRYANPFTIKACGSAERAVAEFEGGLLAGTLPAPCKRLPPLTLSYVLLTLPGRDVACSCPLDQPCHGDVLLRLANGGAS